MLKPSNIINQTLGKYFDSSARRTQCRTKIGSRYIHIILLHLHFHYFNSVAPKSSYINVPPPPLASKHTERDL